MKISQIQIKTNDIKRTRTFYQSVLDLFILKNDQNSVMIRVGDSVLKFVEDSQFNSIYHIAFNIPKNQLEEAIKWCKNKVDLISIEDKNVITHFENWNAHAVYFYDNNGNLLEFIARHDLDNEQGGKFTGASILNISEIGIVTENPLELGNKLIAEHQLYFFSKNANSEVFSAIGDDEGLLILVRPNRNWYPTQTLSESNPTEVTLENKESIIQLKF